MTILVVVMVGEVKIVVTKMARKEEKAIYFIKEDVKV
jgi:hypothetical protein